MTVLTVIPPEPVVTLAQAKAHLRVGHDDDDGMIAACLAAAQRNIDGPDGWLGRAIGVQTLEWVGDGFDDDGCGITLTYPPLIAVLSISYLDGQGVMQTMASDRYLVGTRSRVRPAFGLAWPVPRSGLDTVRIRYQAGYADGAAVPAPLKQAILFTAADLYGTRSATVPAGTIANPTVALLLESYRVFA